MFVSRYMPCEGCGESLDRSVSMPHECTPERLAEFQLFAMRDDIASLEARFRDYLQSAHGRFEAWLATRQIRRTR